MFQYVDSSSFVFLEKEIFAGLAPRKSRAVDLLVKAKFKESDSFFLVHTEVESKSNKHFNEKCLRLLHLHR